MPKFKVGDWIKIVSIEEPSESGIEEYKVGDTGIIVRVPFGVEFHGVYDAIMDGRASLVNLFEEDAEVIQ